MRIVRSAVATGLITALAVAGIAFANGTSQNTAQVVGSVKPSKLDKKKFKPINLFTEVRTQGPVPGINPEAELIKYDKNGKWVTKNAPTCSAQIEFQTTAAAKQSCPPGSAIGSGSASILMPGGVAVTDIVVTAFNGPAKNQIRLHTYSPQLEGATPTVFGQIKKLSGGPYGLALDVPDAPDVAGDTGMITSFGATITKKSGVAQARCKDKAFLIQRTVTYDDGSQEVAQDSQRCKRKR